MKYFLFLIIILISSTSNLQSEYKMVWQHSDENRLKIYGFLIYDDIQNKYNLYSIGYYEINYPFTVEKIIYNYIPHDLETANYFNHGYVFDENNYGFIVKGFCY